MKNRDIDRINVWLDETYGHDLQGQPNFRIVWSTGLTEKRKGIFEDYFGHIFLRAYYTVKEIAKYMYHPLWRDRWVLEKLDYTPNPELALDTAGHYEPLYVFYTREGGYLKPTMAAVQWFMRTLHERKPWKTDKEKWNDLNAAEQAEYDAEAEMFYGCLDDYLGGELADAIRSRTGVVNPGILHLPDGGVHRFNRSSNASNGGVASAVSGESNQAGSVSV